ncbi:16S rRNA (adenine(1518)-N(6)/adenine(1519)-N(6))-dimethyltransferase RsmA [Candidatus Lokiarchaeum ossiferum]|uniref:16S rRNA (adenine(1518)-N(6)/adenine(1519)-N(6))- dimethyltransferase RsmA n=1 Tax=Candidatus Lokiarchaeum ossiferum TaxID=2951803 RepID=UPI00352EA2F7
MPFLSKSALLGTLTTLGIRLDKSRGQCYLIDQNVVEFIVSHAQLDPENDVVIEIGPGLGTLSDYLIQQCKQVILIEFDNKIACYLREYYENKYSVAFLENPTAKDWNVIERKEKIILIHGDALKVPFFPANKIVSNIPYQISAPLIFRIIESWSYSTVNLMVQREFAERLLAPVNSKNYSRISAATGLFLNIKKVRQVPATCFYPAPRVESMLIEITAKPTLSKEKAAFQYRSDYLAFLRGIFPYKNKSIRNALTHYLKRDPHVKEKLSPLVQLISSPADYPFLSHKLRSFSPPQLFSFLLYGLTNDSQELAQLAKQFSIKE